MLRFMESLDLRISDVNWGLERFPIFNLQYLQLPILPIPNWVVIENWEYCELKIDNWLPLPSTGRGPGWGKKAKSFEFR